MATTQSEQPASQEFDGERNRATAEQPDLAAVFGRLEQQLAELVALARQYLQLKKDGATLWIGNVLLWSVAGLLALVVLASLLVTAAVVLVLGLSEFLGELLGGRTWAGYLITGGGLIALTAGGFWCGARLWRRARFRQALAKAVALKQAQRERFGHELTPRS